MLLGENAQRMLLKLFASVLVESGFVPDASEELMQQGGLEQPQPQDKSTSTQRDLLMCSSDSQTQIEMKLKQPGQHLSLMLPLR